MPALVSTILSILGLFAVAVSLAYQSHQAKIAQMIGSRERHVELIQLVTENPSLNIEKMSETEGETLEYRIGMSLWMAHWNMLWHIKKMDERALRGLVKELFQRRAAREWWTRVGATWSSKNSRRERRFITIVTTECDDARASHLSSAAPTPEVAVLPAPAVPHRAVRLRLRRVDASSHRRKKRRPANER